MLYKWGHPVATLPVTNGTTCYKFFESSPLPRARIYTGGFRSQPPRALTAPKNRAARFRSQPYDHSPRV
eukprot:6212484-Pleurochrysis_carterae.AAC.1